MKALMNWCCVLVTGCTLLGCSPSNEAEISGEQRQWHTLTFTFAGPETSENAEVNPFLDYRMNVVFRNSDVSLTVPGYYAADGNAAETSASSGSTWQVRFVPSLPGRWAYTVSFVSGTNIAVRDEPGTPVYFDGASGSFEVIPSNKTGSDFRAKGRLVKRGNYLYHEGNDELFLKSGVDSPENMLGFLDFDGTYFGEAQDEQREGESMTMGNLHRFEPHIQHWNEGDPTWKDGKGKGLIGGLNYLAAVGVNSAYMLLNNVQGDGKDVFPWTAYDSDFRRFDVSKLEQWEIVFSHMDRLGMMCHFVTQETENELMLNEGNLGLERKLFYREMIARFAHHLAITWNLGEENGPAPWMDHRGQNDEQRKAMAGYIKQMDPYGNLVVLHTLPSSENKEVILSELVGFDPLDGPSLQAQPDEMHEETLKWRKRSLESGHPWVVCSDEIGPHTRGALPDAIDATHDTLRHQVIWGNLMAGGAGVEWYFGYMYPNTDLTCEDWSTRENLYRQTRIATDFFREILPVDELEPADDLIDGSGYGMRKGNELFVFYKPMNEELEVTLPERVYELAWFDPRNGGNLVVQSPGFDISNLRPPSEPDQDWVVIVRTSD